MSPIAPPDTASLGPELGNRLITTIHSSLAALRLYPLDNEIVQHTLAELDMVARDALDRHGTLSIELVGDFFFVNGARMELDLSNYSAFGSVAQTLKGHGVGGVEIAAGVSVDEWVRVLSWLLRDAAPQDPFGALEKSFLDGTALHFAIHPFQERSEVQDPSQLESAKITYARSIHIAKKVLADARLGRAISTGPMKRAAQGIVDEVVGNGPCMITMTTLRDFDDYTFTHSVNVAIFSIVIGQSLKLSRNQLYELGLCALLHDFGKLRTPAEILNKPGRLTDEERTCVQQHSTDGLLALYNATGMGEAPFRPMLVAYEHHMRLGGGGYPENRRPRVPGLYSRIVTVSDVFDAATSKRVYTAGASTPDRILKEMMSDAGFDPLVVRAFINQTGVFPVGTLVVFDTMELGIVAQANADRNHLHQPVVKIIADGMGNALAEPIDVDLSDEVASQGRTIVKTTEASRYGIVVSDYLLG
ncbi:MAG: HD-GYP domain-containing protein [Longimicrobiales bacterium]